LNTLIAANQPAPDFSLPDLSGKLYCLADFRGRIVALNFWSADCPHAVRVDGALLELMGARPGYLVLVSIASNTNEDQAHVRQAARARGLPLVLLDDGHQLADAYGAVTTPHLFLIDSRGLLRYQGAFDDVTFRRRSPRAATCKRRCTRCWQGGSPKRPTRQPMAAPW